MAWVGTTLATLPRQFTNWSFDKPTDGDVIAYDGSNSQWVNTPGSSIGANVVTDDDTIEGDGTALTPVKLKRSYTDMISLEGSGVPTDPIKIRKVVTDDDTTEGDGIDGDPVKIKKVYVKSSDLTGTGVSNGTAIELNTQLAVTTGSTYVISPRVQINTKGIVTSAETLTGFQVFWKGTQSFSNGGTFPNWIDDTAGTIDNNYLYFNGGMFNGVSAPHLYGSPVSGIFTVTIYIAWTPIATGFRAVQLIIQKTSGGAFVELYRATVSGSTTSNGPHQSITWTFPCAAQCQWGIKAQQDSGSTMTNVPVAVTITGIQGPIGS